VAASLSLILESKYSTYALRADIYLIIRYPFKQQVRTGEIVREVQA